MGSSSKLQVALGDNKLTSDSNPTQEASAEEGVSTLVEEQAKVLEVRPLRSMQRHHPLEELKTLLSAG